jgi:hypothetical protein
MIRGPREGYLGGSAYSGVPMTENNESVDELQEKLAKSDALAKKLAWHLAESNYFLEIALGHNQTSTYDDDVRAGIDKWHHHRRI